MNSYPPADPHPTDYSTPRNLERTFLSHEKNIMRLIASQNNEDMQFEDALRLSKWLESSRWNTATAIIARMNDTTDADHDWMVRAGFVFSSFAGVVPRIIGEAEVSYGFFGVTIQVEWDHASYGWAVEVHRGSGHDEERVPLGSRVRSTRGEIRTILEMFDFPLSAQNAYDHPLAASDLWVEILEALEHDEDPWDEQVRGTLAICRRERKINHFK